jgi:hypothetical protein
MDIPDKPDFTSRQAKHALIERARREFRCFYSNATFSDVLTMDALVMIHETLQIGLRARRTLLPWPVRSGLERSCDATERAFMDAREAVQLSTSYKLLDRSAQGHIAALLFNGANSDGG